MFIGRKEELNTLREHLDSPGFELGIIYGQRRIGKTSLILEAVQGHDYIYFLARESDERENLAYFTQVMTEKFQPRFPLSFDRFDQLLDALIDSVKDRPFTIIIDELPFLEKSYPAILSYLQGASDAAKRENRPLKILLSGSDVSFMVHLLENKGQPLYQRATFKIHVEPLCFSDAAMMLSGFEDADIIRFLCVFGNRPYYLEKLNPRQSFEENLLRLCFNPDSILVDAPNVTLPIGYANNSVYLSILVALANHKQRCKDIASALGIADNAASTYLLRMLRAEAIEKRQVFRGNRKTVYYEIRDPFIRFYFRLIRPNLLDIERRLGPSVFSANASIVQDIVDRGFEDVVNSYMDERNAKGLLPGYYHSFQRLTIDRSSLGRPVQIDGLADSLDGKRLLAIEAKFRNKDVSKEVLDHLRESASLFSGEYEDTYCYLFSKTGFAANLTELRDDHVFLVSIRDMIHAEP